MEIDYELIKIDRIQREVSNSRNGLLKLTEKEKEYMVLCESCNNIVLSGDAVSERKIINKLMNTLSLTKLQAHRLLTDTKEIFGTKLKKQKDFERNWQIERLKGYLERLTALAKAIEITNTPAATKAYEVMLKIEDAICVLMAYDKEDDTRIDPAMLIAPDILFTPNPAILGRPLPELVQTLEDVRSFMKDKKINIELIDTIEHDDQQD